MYAFETLFRNNENVNMNPDNWGGGGGGGGGIGFVALGPGFKGPRRRVTKKSFQKSNKM